MLRGAMAPCPPPYTCLCSYIKLQSILHLKGSNLQWNKSKFALQAQELCKARSGFAKQRKKLCQFIKLSNQSTQFLALFCKTMSGFAKHLSPKCKLCVVPLLVGALHLSHLRVSLASSILFEDFDKKFILDWSGFFFCNMIMLTNKIEGFIRYAALIYHCIPLNQLMYCS